MGAAMKPMRRIAAALLFCGAASAASQAGELFEVYLAGVDGGHPCYARAYDAKHLKAHPRQKIARIEIDMEPVNPDGVANVASGFQIGIGLMAKAGGGWYTGAAYCTTSAIGFSCSIEGDGGTFTLVPADARSLKLSTERMALEGAKDFIEIGDKAGDDRVFVLQREAQADCDAATADASPAGPSGKK